MVSAWTVSILDESRVRIFFNGAQVFQFASQLGDITEVGFGGIPNGTATASARGSPATPPGSHAALATPDAEEVVKAVISAAKGDMPAARLILERCTGSEG